MMEQTLGLDSVIQALRLLTTSSQGTLFLPQMSNRVEQFIHWKVRNYSDIETPDKWYEHELLSVVDTLQVTILWDFQITTDRIIQAKRRDKVTKH